jgi:hypothetical protein
MAVEACSTEARLVLLSPMLIGQGTEMSSLDTKFPMFLVRLVPVNPYYLF